MLLSWNVKGLNAPNKRHLVKKRIDLTRDDIVLIQEIKQSKDEVEMLFNNFKYWKVEVVQADGAFDGLTICWNSSYVFFEFVTSGKHWIGQRVKNSLSNLYFIMINVHGPVSYLSKRSLWIEIDKFLATYPSKHFTLRGVLNIILYR